MTNLMSEGCGEDDAAMNLTDGTTRETFVESHVVYCDSDSDQETDNAPRCPYERELGLPQRTTTGPKAVECPGCKKQIATKKSTSGRFSSYSNLRKHVKTCDPFLQSRVFKALSPAVQIDLAGDQAVTMTKKGPINVYFGSKVVPGTTAIADPRRRTMLTNAEKKWKQARAQALFAHSSDRIRLFVCHIVLHAGSYSEIDSNSPAE